MFTFLIDGLNKFARNSYFREELSIIAFNFDIKIHLDSNFQSLRLPKQWSTPTVFFTFLYTRANLIMRLTLPLLQHVFRPEFIAVPRINVEQKKSPKSAVGYARSDRHRQTGRRSKRTTSQYRIEYPNVSSGRRRSLRRTYVVFHRRTGSRVRVATTDPRALRL